MITFFLLILSLLFVPVVGAQSVALTWDANSESDLGGYNAYRWTAGVPRAKINPSLITCAGNDITCVFFTDSTTIFGLQYSYVVTAVNTSALESGDSNIFVEMIPNPDAPAPPGNLRAPQQQANRFILEWDLVQEAILYNIFTADVQQRDWFFWKSFVNPPSEVIRATGNQRYAKAQSVAENGLVSDFSNIVAMK